MLSGICSRVSSESGPLNYVCEASVTPDDFPNASSYISWVKLCEDSIESDFHAGTYWEATDAFNCFRTGCSKKQPCRIPNHEPGNADGIVYTNYPGYNTASNFTSPIFTIKGALESHGDFCGMCY